MGIFERIVARGSVAKSAAIYLGGGIVGRIIPFLLLPVLTRYLTPGDYGLVGTFQSVLVLAGTFVGINLNGAIVRSYTKLPREDFSNYIFNCLVLTVFSSLLVYVVFITCGGFISDLTKIPYAWLLSIPVIAAGTFLFNNVLSVHRVKGKAVSFCSWNILYSGCNLFIALVLVVGFHMDWRGMVIGIATANIVFGVMALIFLWKNRYVRTGLHTPFLKDALLFGSPLILHHVSTWVGSMLNRPLLSSFSGLGAAGLFYTSCMIASVITLFDAAFEQAWTPWLYRQLNIGTAVTKLKIVKITYLYITGLVILVFLVSFAAKLALPWFLGKEFIGSGDYVFLVALANAFIAMRRSVFGYALYENKSYVIGVTTVVTTIVGILLNYILIRSSGAAGAAHAMVFGALISFILTWFMANRVYPMPWLLRASIDRETSA